MIQVGKGLTDAERKRLLALGDNLEPAPFVRCFDCKDTGWIVRIDEKHQAWGRECQSCKAERWAEKVQKKQAATTPLETARQAALAKRVLAVGDVPDDGIPF